MSEKINLPSFDFDPANYKNQLDKKKDDILTLFNELEIPSPDVFESPNEHFRMRCEFRIWHDYSNGDDTCFYVMFEKEAPTIPIKIHAFPIASRAITDLMSPLLKAINSSTELKKKLFQIEFLSTTQKEVLVTLIYHRPLESTWELAAKNLESHLSITVIGRSRKQKNVLSKDYVTEELTIDSKGFLYEQKENSFTQPNATINCKMIEWILLNTEKTQKSLLELYCGNGNFTIPLSFYFNKVLATEISKTSIASAKKNCLLNNVENIEFVRLSGEETASALNKERAFRRLSHINLDEYNFSTVFVDPPRAGLDSKTLHFIKNFDQILYISCNPKTLFDNLFTLKNHYEIKCFAIFDQFPYTEHCECGVILKRRYLS